ncbi:hypothetical protein L596_011109 [Steinernema carpocapsae]|uniref:Calcyclin-binding protein n=1 Tax=Steinernema carpocapsae TaxID=34508 RepID=A0A4U5NTD2_STECR|nr:hypothetical protein L596_011109 [Steinernema carpocapsae]
MALNIEDIEKDMLELSQIRVKCQRPNIQKILDKHLADYCDQLKKATAEAEKQKATKEGQAAAAPVNPLLPRPKTKITTYAYDESDKFMKLYITINGVQTVPAERISVEFTNNSVVMKVSDVNGRDYEMRIVDLAGIIVPEKSIWKQKTDKVLLMMKKSKEGETWNAVIRAGKKEKMMPDIDPKADPQEGLMTMMKKMYDEGDDEMKRTIRKSFYENRNKSGDSYTMPKDFGDLPL